MNTVPNQKTIQVQKEKSNKDNLYSIFNLKALQHAMIDLKGESFKLWCYINKNQSGHTFALSKVDAISWGIGSKSSYDRAVRELIDKKYLVATSNNHYDFYELPKEEVVYVTKVS
jgi:hypothetical protein